MRRVRMGATGSRVVNKIASSFSYHGSPSEDYTDYAVGEHAVASFKGTPFVYSRQGSMYFDEDGDLAHEFYEEVGPRRRGGKKRMKRIDKDLTPQGEVKYRVPCLHADFPIILYAD